MHSGGVPDDPDAFGGRARGSCRSHPLPRSLSGPSLFATRCSRRGALRRAIVITAVIVDSGSAVACEGARRTIGPRSIAPITCGEPLPYGHRHARRRRPCFRSEDVIKGLVRLVPQVEAGGDSRDVSALPTSLPRGYSSAEDGSSGPVSRRGVDEPRVGRSTGTGNPLFLRPGIGATGGWERDQR